MKSQVKLVSITKGAGELEHLGAQELIAYTARVSNPANQMNSETAPKLINYLIRNKHWSPLEMVSLTIEIVTSRAIAAQILRHRSFSFQEFSQRYAEATDYIVYEPRRQDTKNRQNSIDDLSREDVDWFLSAVTEVHDTADALYKEALQRGIAKESARMLLPLSTQTRIYMSGTARSWVHYIDLRSGNGTQAEHKEIALQCKDIFAKELPDVAKAMGWTEEEGSKS